MLNAALYPKHSYGRPSFGSEKNVAQVTSKSLRALHKKLQNQAQSLCVVGDITAQQVETFLERNFDRQFKGPTSTLKKLPVGPVRGQSLRHQMKKEQTHIALGYRSADFFSKDRPALLGLGALLSGQGGRLFVELRDKLSLCYTVSPTHQEGLDVGHFAFYIATSPEKTEQAIQALDAQIDRLVAGDISEGEWAKARQFFVGNHIIENQRLGSQATSLAIDTLYGLDSSECFGFEDKLNAVSAADLNRVAAKYFSPKAKKSRVTVVVGPR
jgi:zinc protease